VTAVGLHPGSETLLLTVPAVFRVASESVRRAWRVLKTAVGKADRERWKNPSDPAYQTVDRNRLIAALIPDGSHVLDLGAGTQQLRRLLPPGCKYQPCDLDGGPDVLDCDFNAGRYPAVTRRYDVLVASGLLEFLRDPEAFLSQLPTLGEILLFSYRARPPGEPLRWRLESGYLSHLTTVDLETMLDRFGYRWKCVGVYEHQRGGRAHMQPIYRVALTPGTTATGVRRGAVGR